MMGEQMIINMIGAGRLGKTIARLITENDAGVIQAVCNQTMASSIDACTFIGCGKPVSDISNALPPADLTFITTSDGSIETAAMALANAHNLKPGSIVVHCSGALTSQALKALKAHNCPIASVHPMHSFASPDMSVMSFEGTYCAIEGDPAALLTIQSLFSAIGGITYPIHSDRKSLYHASGVMASNYLVTLCDQARQCLERAGVESNMAMKSSRI